MSLNNQAFNKKLSQNFLKDHTIIENIIRHTRIDANDHVVEIGPGYGALTQHLVRVCKRIDTIEFDKNLIKFLKQQYAYDKHLHLHYEDASRFDFQRLYSPYHPLKIIGNLPYHITSPLLFHLLDYSQYIQEMTLMMQKEVANRICAAPCSKIYGRLSVMLQSKCRVKPLFDVSPSAFWPSPQVTSQVVRLMPHNQNELIQNDQLFHKVVKQAFAQRRKMIKNNLGALIDTHALEKLGVNARDRPENLTIQDYVNITNTIGQKL